MTLLAVEGLYRHFGGVAAVDNVGFDVREGEILGLIGPNGSGKTTVLNMLSGFLEPHAGKVKMRDRDITGWRPDRLAREGVLRMFQMTRVFTRTSAFDNLLTAGMARGLSEAEATNRAGVLLEELTLAPVQHLDAGQLSGGQRKLLEFGMCFIEPPVLAMLDEPFAAVHPVMRDVMAKFIRARHAQGATFLLVSHDMPIVVDLCQRAVCMNAGRVIASGDIHSVLGNHDVIEAYLGESHEGEDPPTLEVHP
ncbi:MAG TPA: ATP-binding cassette domain-containing protein [Ramlibacter sp.]|nr:ATP-binding cassette domain-containing protein [Ramlibacter sp.]